MEFSDDFWGISVADVIRMEFEEIVPTISEASGGLSESKIVVEVTKKRIASESHARTLACSRIISAFIGGPDIINE